MNSIQPGQHRNTAIALKDPCLPEYGFTQRQLLKETNYNPAGCCSSATNGGVRIPATEYHHDLGAALVYNTTEFIRCR